MVSEIHARSVMTSYSRLLGEQVSDPSQGDPVGGLRGALIDALMDLPFINALSDRRMLLTLIRQGVVRFPDVEEKPEARLHVVYIVMTCMSHPGGLRALRAALETMAPHSEGTRQARRLIESAMLSALIADSELERIKTLLWRSASSRAQVRAVVGAADAPEGSADTEPIVHFVRLTRQPVPERGLPAALVFVEEIAAQADPAEAVHLRAWVDQQAERLELASRLRAHRDRAGGARVPDREAVPTEPVEADARGEMAEITISSRWIR